MKIVLLLLLLALIATITARAYAEQGLSIGDVAPDFALSNQYGETVSLKTYQGKWLVLYFYPKNNTPGCTTEACSFRDNMTEFEKRGVQVVGISIDNQQAHANFANAHKLPFPLVADVDGKVAQAYGAMMDLWVMKFAKRYTFIINPSGHIAKIYQDVKPKQHTKQLIQDLDKLIQERS